MAWVFPLVPLGVSFAIHYQHMQPDTRQANSHELRKDVIVERLGCGPWPVAQLTDEQFETFIRINTVGKHGEDEFRLVRKKSPGQKKAPELTI
jgi:hypothetical protein